jgi:sulfonate transport system substrate-binding protein
MDMARLAQGTILVALLAFAGAIGCRKEQGPKVERPEAIRLDYAYYNPVGLLLKDKRWLEEDLAKDGIQVEWTHSAGSNKALEFLNSRSVDFGSTAGAAALLARANGNPIRSVYVYSKPEWTALVTRPDTGIAGVADLEGKKVAVTRGTDPHIFLLRALDSVGLTERDVEIVPLQHADGKNALERGDVDAWSGLDPMMATTELEKGSKLFFRNPDLNTYGILNVRADFAARYPAYVERVIAAYERARHHALAHPDELKATLIRYAKISDPVATVVLGRTHLTHSVIGEKERSAIIAAGDVLKKNGVVKPETDVQAVAAALFEPKFADTVVAARKGQ